MYNWFEADEELKEGKEEVADSLLDKTESQLMKRIKGYSYTEVTKELRNPKKSDREKIEPELVVTKKVTKHVVPDVGAIAFFLKTKGKKRGYIESSHVDMTSGGKPMEMPKPVIIRRVKDGEEKGDKQ